MAQNNLSFLDGSVVLNDFFSTTLQPRLESLMKQHGCNYEGDLIRCTDDMHFEWDEYNVSTMTSDGCVTSILDNARNRIINSRTNIENAKKAYPDHKVRPICGLLVCTSRLTIEKPLLRAVFIIYQYGKRIQGDVDTQAHL